jgi:heterotetrameric sarcosine oxidase gamma subunit
VTEPPAIARSPVPDHLCGRTEGLTLSDESLMPTWRVFADPPVQVRPGTARRDGEHLVWSVTPSEWTVVGPRPPGEEVVDLAHVRAMLRLTGVHARAVLSRVCALDLGDDRFPPGAAARTLVAGVATEIVRDDLDGERSYRLLPSRSFAAYLAEVLVAAGAEYGLRAGADGDRR